MHRNHFIVILTFALSLSAAQADLAFFSVDGQTVTFSPQSREGLLNLNTSSGKLTKIALGAGAEKESVTSLCRGGDGEILLTTDAGVYVHDAKGTRKLANAPVKGQWAIGDLVAAPAQTTSVGDWLFLAGNDPKDQNQRIFYSRKPGAKTFSPVFCRRVKTVGAAAFTADGRLFFGGESDLWEGNFSPMGDEGMLVLNGVRIAPLGVRNTDEANSGSMAVEQVMVAGSSLYVRLRGHLQGEIVRVPIPAATTMDEEKGVRSSTAASYQVQGQLLAKAQVITTSQEAIHAAAATAAGGQERLFYKNGATLFLWDAKSGRAKQMGTEE